MNKLCPACNKEILMVMSFDTGAVIPLEEAQHVYRFIGSGYTQVQSFVKQVTDENLLVSHALYCKQPDEFSEKDK